MVTVSETKKYIVNPKNLLNNAFDSSFSKFIDTLPASPPDTGMLICSCLSMMLLIMMFILTGNKFPSDSLIWYGLAIVCSILGLRFIYKYVKDRGEYLKSSGRPSQKEKKREEFIALLYPEEIPEKARTTDIIQLLSPLMGRQSDPSFNEGLRSASEYIAKKNNPDLPLCKLLTPFGEVFTQAKRRFYMSLSDGVITFQDSDWQNPKGEITCSEDDIISFGFFSKYPSRINSAGGGKIHPDAVIVEVNDGTEHLYFEFHSKDYDKIRKILSGRKELK